ncbi:centromere protein J-like [Rhineura floridana]|uniref:centromere protein J-like n=1 Tax=Rhineura floridana TaxID=261503 RepID=UPI002AC7F022|nr:centromere protein J-like [Rhineura floridana]
MAVQLLRAAAARMQHLLLLADPRATWDQGTLSGRLPLAEWVRLEPQGEGPPGCQVLELFRSSALLGCTAVADSRCGSPGQPSQAHLGQARSNALSDMGEVSRVPALQPPAQPSPAPTRLPSQSFSLFLFTVAVATTAAPDVLFFGLLLLLLEVTPFFQDQGGFIHSWQNPDSQGFRRWEMESDIFKRKGYLSREITKDSPEQVSSYSTTDERVSSSFGLGWINSPNYSFPAHFTSLHTSLNSNTLGRDVDLPCELSHPQAFQDVKPFNYTTNSVSPPRLLPPTQAEIVPGSKNNENLGITSDAAAAATSPPLITQETLFCQQKQSPGQQEQLMMHQMEHLQRLVTEQQKIIAFYNPGFSACAGIPPHLHAMIPSVPEVPTAVFPVQLSLGSSLQAQNNGCSQTSPVIINPTLQQCATQASANGSFLEVSKEHLEPRETESWLETLPLVKEEKGEQQVDENVSLSPFGQRMNMGARNVDDRPIRPGIGVRQKTFEEFVEEQFKADSQRAEKKQQNSCETKATSRKSFLRCGEGTARLEKSRDHLGKEPTRLLRRVSFDCPNNFPWSAQWDTEKLLGRHPQLKRRVSSPTVLFMDDENTHWVTSKDDLKGQLNNCEQRSEERKGSSDSGSHHGKETVNEKGSDVPPPFNWFKCSQECHEEINEMKEKVTEKTEVSCPGSQEHLVRVDNRALDSKVPVWLIEDVKDSVSQVVGRPIDASPDVSEQASQKDQSSGCQVAQGVNRTGQCENEYYIAVEKSPEIQVEICPRFKKVNDQIIKVTPKSESKHITTMANSQRNSEGAANAWKVKPLSSDSVCTSTDSEDEPKSHCSQYSIRPRYRRAGNTGKNMDLSDADYATDEPSGAEDYSFKSHGKLPTKKLSVQEPTGQQEASLIESSSSNNNSVESTVENGSPKFGKTHSPLRRSPCHLSKMIREPEKHSRDIIGNYDAQFSLQPPSLMSDLVASLFPVFKRKANLEDKRATLEQVQKRQTDMAMECEPEVQVHRRETSLLAQMKEEQAKAMDFLRRQISQFEAKRLQKLHPLEQCKTEEALKLQKERAEFEQHIVGKEEGESGEIQVLKQQIAGLQEKFRRNETHWHAAHGELRSQVEALTKQNLELQDELRVSEFQKIEAERKHGVTDFTSTKGETLVSAAILRGTSSEENQEDRPSRNSHKNPSNRHMGRKIAPLDELAPRDRDMQATRGTLQRSESLKSATGEQRAKSPSKILHNRSATPTGRRTPNQTPFELQKALPQLAHNQQQNYGRKTPVSDSNLSVLKDISPALYVKGTFSSTSGSSEDAALLNSRNNDNLSSISLSNVGVQVKENPSHKRAQDFKKSSEQVASMTISKRNSIASNGRNTPTESCPTFLDAKSKVSPLKSILSRRASLYVESKDDGEVKEKTEYPDGKMKQLLTDGRRIITYPNGTKMEISADKRTTVVTFYNGDIKKILPDQRVIYYYAEAQTTRTVYPSGLEVLHFSNNQIEKYHPDGTEEIVFPDQTVKRRYDGGMMEETVFPDGTVVKVEKSGIKTIQFCNGKKEIHTALSTRREYPDGTVKTIYANGQQETKYSSGRVRIKDEKGILILDKK